MLKSKYPLDLIVAYFALVTRYCRVTPTIARRFFSVELHIPRREHIKRASETLIYYCATSLII